MILLDTHVWVWMLAGDRRYTEDLRRLVGENDQESLGVCSISCWEVAKLVQLGRLGLDRDVGDWLGAALAGQRIRLIPLFPRVAVESTRLPGGFHRDPADQIIVATARVLDCPLLTRDARLLAYPHVTTPT